MKTKLENAKIELIAWLNDECPKVWPPLEPYTTADLSHDFAEKLRERLDNIIILKGNSLSDEPTAMEMIKEVFEPIQLRENEVVNQALNLASKKAGKLEKRETQLVKISDLKEGDIFSFRTWKKPIWWRFIEVKQNILTNVLTYEEIKSKFRHTSESVFISVIKRIS